MKSDSLRNNPDDKLKYIKIPNHIVTSNYKMTALQKRILYIIIEKIQYLNLKNPDRTNQPLEIDIEYSDLDTNRNYENIRKAILGLIATRIDFEMNIPKSNDLILKRTVIISGDDYIPRTKQITIEIPKRALEVISHISGGYTKVQTCVILNLKSMYTQSMYELCCRWKDKGGFSYSIKGLREEYLNIKETKYKQVSNLRLKVLDVAQKELKKKADVYFTYKLLKKSSRSFNYISIKIHRNVPDADNNWKGTSENDYSSVYYFLNIFYPNYIDDKALSYTNKLSENGNLKRASFRFKGLLQEYKNKDKDKKSITNLLDFVILPELEVKSPKKTNHTFNKNGVIPSSTS